MINVLKTTTTLVLLTQLITSFAFTWQVGPSHEYAHPNALYLADQSGEINILDDDSIAIESSDYLGTEALAAWQQNNLFIYGVGEKPHMIANGESILGKGIWVCVGNNITIQNIEFSEATVPDENGAGIRLDGTGMTILGCYFHHNENGILTSNPGEGTIIIQYTEFAYNGFGDGYTHNMYIGHVTEFIMEYCYSHHTFVGHNVKSRATKNTIRYNRIMDEETGNSSRLIDIPNGGETIIVGNILMQGEYAINNNAVGYGLEGLSNPSPHSFRFVNNTIINKRTASCNYLSIADGTEDAYVVNNIFAGTGTLLDGEATVLANNYFNPEIAHFQFKNEPEYNYQLTVLSPAIDSGIAVLPDVMPAFQYVHPLDKENRVTSGASIDIGAYEYSLEVAGIDHDEMAEFILQPNPADKLVTIHFDGLEKGKTTVQIFALNGKCVFDSDLNYSPYTMDISTLESGMYMVRLHTGNSTQDKRLLVH
jgi:hypothetical protein